MTATQTVEHYFSALAAGNVDEVFSYFDDAAIWEQPGNHQFSGTKTGPAEIGAMVGGMMEVSGGSFVIKPTGPLMQNGDMVAVTIQATGTHGDATLDMQGVDLLQVKDGKITNVWLFTDYQDKEDAFWGSK